MTVELLSAIAGIVLSLAFSYIPGLNTKFAAMSDQYKKLSMLGMLALVAGVTFGLTCTKYGAMIGIPLTCDETGAIELVRILIAAAVANQAMYKLTPQRQEVKDAKLEGEASRLEESYNE